MDKIEQWEIQEALRTLAKTLDKPHLAELIGDLQYLQGEDL